MSRVYDEMFRDEIIELHEATLAEIERLKNMTYCAYCGTEFPLDDEAANQVSDHIRTCDKHPMRELEALAASRLVMLRRIEWVPGSGGEYFCLFCHGYKEDYNFKYAQVGHANNCELAEELGDGD